MRREPSQELLEFFAELCAKYGLPADTQVHINMPIICDRCQDEEKEAFPYFTDKDGKPWSDLCNQCWEEAVGPENWKNWVGE
jgi:hypothetical protein